MFFQDGDIPKTTLADRACCYPTTTLAWSTFGTFYIQSQWSWRIPSLLQGLPSLFQFSLIYFIPESPRWLVDHGKEEQARVIFTKYHCNGDHTDPLIDFEIEEIKTAIVLENEARQGTGWKSLIATKGNRKRMTVIIAIAFFS